MGVSSRAAYLLCLGELQCAGGGRVGHRPEGLCGRGADAAHRAVLHDTDRHHVLRDLLPVLARCQRLTLRRGHGHPQPAAQARLLLLRLPNVPRARRRLQPQLWCSWTVPLCDARQKRLHVHRPAGRGFRPSHALQPGLGRQLTAGPALLTPHRGGPPLHPCFF